MSQSTETGTFDEGRPLPYRCATSTSIGSDSSNSASEGSSISSVRNVIGGMVAKDWIFVSTVILFSIMLGLDITARSNQIEAERTAAVAADLAKFNAQQLQVQAEVNKQLMAALMCRR